MVLCEELYKLCLIYFSTSLLHWHYYYFSQMLSRTLRVDTLVTGIVILAPGPKLSDTAILPPEYPMGTCVFGSLVISVINYPVLLVYFKLMEKSKKNKSQTHRIQNAECDSTLKDFLKKSHFSSKIMTFDPMSLWVIGLSKVSGWFNFLEKWWSLGPWHGTCWDSSSVPHQLYDFFF